MKDNLVRKFNRFELKYIVSLETAEKLKKEILKYAKRDSYGGESGKYWLSSLYYDSPKFKYYWEKIDGLRYRKKLRIRWYEDENGLNDDSIVFLEIKQRVDRVIQKRRIPITYKEARLFCDEGIIPKVDDEYDKKVLEEMYEMIKLNNLEPKVITSYNREAFVGSRYDIGFRLTFDNFVGYSYRNLDMNLRSADGFMIPPNYSIMEIKTNECLPYWVTEMVSRNQLKLIRISKYCEGINNANLIN